METIQRTGLRGRYRIPRRLLLHIRAVTKLVSAAKIALRVRLFHTRPNADGDDVPVMTKGQQPETEAPS